MTPPAASSPANPAEPGSSGGTGDVTTLADIARTAGVSTPTVSKVLNGRADVAPATRERIEEVLREYGYNRRRATTPAPLLDLVFRELPNAWALEMIAGAEQVAHAEGLSLVLSKSAGRESWLDGILARRPAGALLVISDLTLAEREQLAARDIPFVVIDPAGELEPDVPAVGATNWQGGLDATRHLLDLGHRRIGMVAGPDRMLCSRARVNGYRAALESAGVPLDPALVRVGEFSHAAGYAEGRKLLRARRRPTAIVAGDDLQALGVYEAARELGLRIPDDLSVVGFDDLELAQWVGPPLTTVHQPLAEMAAAAARIVVDLARGRQPTATRIQLATRLVERGSTAAPRKTPTRRGAVDEVSASA